MVRNIPTRFTSLSLMEILNQNGFGKSFDYFYLPMDFKTQKNCGYAFINFVTNDHCRHFFKKFQGLQLKASTSHKFLDIVVSKRQGFRENICVFQSSDLLSSSNHLDHFKPMVMINDDLVALDEKLFNSFFVQPDQPQSMQGEPRPPTVQTA